MWLALSRIFSAQPDLHFNRLITGQLARTPGCDSVGGLARSGRQPLPVDGRQLAVQCTFQGCQKSSALILGSPAGCLLSEAHRKEHMTPSIRGTSVKLKTDHSGLLAGGVCRSAVALNAILTRRSFFFLSRRARLAVSGAFSVSEQRGREALGFKKFIRCAPPAWMKCVSFRGVKRVRSRGDFCWMSAGRPKERGGFPHDLP